MGKKIQKDFDKFLYKKLLIYGSGKNAIHLIENLHSCLIVGVVDRVKMNGDVAGVPVCTLDDIQKGDVDILIIASREDYYRDIYWRIVGKCQFLGIEIYGMNGQNLSIFSQLESDLLEDVQYYKKCAEELKEMIDCHDVISFDIFDTLIMRRTLEPADVFDLVADRIYKKGEEIPYFRMYRQEAELRVGIKDIYCIYEELKKMTGISALQMDLIMQEEIKCEQDVLLPRKKMVEILQYAKQSGKKVTLISDMYLPKEIMKNLLSDMGICDYDELMISCDYGCAKGNGLFQYYLNKIGNYKSLHVGDNRVADVQIPQKYGMDAYGIKSAYDMLKISNYRKILMLVRNNDDRLLVGTMISETFNNPFSLSYEMYFGNENLIGK